MRLEIYYQKSQFFTSLLHEFIFVPDVTHEQMEVMEIESQNIPKELEKCFFHYNWMWNNEGECTSEFTNKVRKSKDIRHSSMSVGDVVVVDNNPFVCAECGWTLLDEAYVIKEYIKPIFDEKGELVKK